MANEEFERTLIGGALSYEFPDCSIAAADLGFKANRLALEKTGNYFLIGDRAEQQTFELSWMKSAFALDGYASALVLARPKTQAVTKNKGLVRRFGRQNPVNEISDPEPKQDVVLAIRAGKDTLLPLASFARRANGNCSYVQLGQEMENDNFYVTTGDDQTDRFELIEAFRAIISGDNFSDDQKGVVQKFIDQQAGMHHKELALAYERQLATVALDRLGQVHAERRLQVLGEAGAVNIGHYDTRYLIPPRGIAGGRSFSLIIAAPRQFDAQPYDRGELMAVTRGEVALPIAQINRLFGEVEFDNGLQTDEARLSVIRQLLSMVSALPPELPAYRPRYNYEFISWAALYCAKLGLITTPGVGDYTRTQIDPERDRKLYDFLSFPTPERLAEMDIETVAILDLALANLTENYQRDYSLFRRLGIDEKFNYHLGPPQQASEFLLHQVGALALNGGQIEAVFSNEPINNTRSDVDIAVFTEAFDETYEVTISGRPQPMQDEPLKPLVTLWVDPTKKQPVTKAGEAVPLRDSDIQEVSELLARIMASSLVKS